MLEVISFEDLIPELVAKIEELKDELAEANKKIGILESCVDELAARLDRERGVVMCSDCWSRAGMPQIDTPATREAIAAFQAADGDMGPLLEDYNVEDEFLDDDTQTLRSWIDKVWTEGHVMKIIHAINLLRPLTERERISVLACVDEYWTLK